MSVTVGRDDVARHEEFARWNESVSRSLAPVIVTTARGVPFQASITADEVGVLRVSAIEADPQRVVRPMRLITRCPGESVIVVQQLSGVTLAIQDGRETRLEPGGLLVCDTDRPYVLDQPERFRALVFRLPRTAVGIRSDVLRRVTASPIHTDCGVGALLAPFLTRLADSASLLVPSVSERLAGTTADLLAALIMEQAGTLAVDVRDGQGALMHRIQRYISSRLGDVDLSPESVAAANHISVRYLHKLFERDGITVRRWIQQRRLEQCRRELAGRDALVSAVAQRWGFVNTSHFSRTFKAAYGVSPRDWKHQRAAATAGQHQPTAA
ncbi:transcriptional regulator, AraC family [Micromonospora echinaurantiaca]|uniref:Transcriptional regulator, AraC family n=1 Tax=Micromonospora echinaurantiaca TaxID=47857 RepID=A0A1C5IEZ2_9ACTN|nr:helix-turn-helix domain-containing protein [Micromonospora echinaurantiaca]SCG56930.1 transcriptional regulator, AraC family [Micromonospora echinaurantiaca]